MGELLRLVLALVAGVGLGLVYFGGLWLTVQRVPGSGHPGLLVLGSFLGRTVAVVGGIYLAAVLGGEPSDVWARVAVCLVGFLAMRTVMVRRLRPTPGESE